MKTKIIKISYFIFTKALILTSKIGWKNYNPFDKIVEKISLSWAEEHRNYIEKVLRPKGKQAYCDAIESGIPVKNYYICHDEWKYNYSMNMWFPVKSHYSLEK